MLNVLDVLLLATGATVVVFARGTANMSASRSFTWLDGATAATGTATGVV